MKNKSLYVLEAIACICLVFIHCRFPGNLGLAIDYFARFAVPLFFMVSGYFSYSANKDKVKKKIFKQLSLFIISMSLYFIYMNALYYLTIEDYSILTNIGKIFSLKNILEFGLFNYTSAIISHLWFIAALICCYIFRYVTINTEKEKTYKFIPFVLLITYIVQVYLLVIVAQGNLKIFVRNWFAIGIPFFILGYNLNHYKEKIKNIKNNKLIICSILSICVIFIEKLILNKIGENVLLELYLGNILFVVSMFILAINNPNPLNFKFLSNLGECYSLNIYILHYGVIRFLNDILGTKYAIHINEYIKPILVVVITLIISVLYNKLKNLIKNKNSKQLEK